MPTPAQAEYDRLAPAYNRRWSRYIEASRRATLEGLDPRPGERVLDLATGTGELARHLAGRWPSLRVVGYDLSRGMLLRGEARRPVALVQGDASRLPFADGAFDRVVSASGFHCFPRPAPALAELRRILRPGGLVTLTDWCDDYLACRLVVFYLRLTGDPATHRAYTLADCRRLLAAAGLDVLAGRRFRIDWPWGLMRLDARRPA